MSFHEIMAIPWPAFASMRRNINKVHEAFNPKPEELKR